LRLQYLEAMGIDVWIPRTSTFTVQPFVEEKLEEIPSHKPESNAFEQLSKQPQYQSIWDDLQAEVAACTKCDLCQTRTQTVFGTGRKSADWMIIGEAPGQHEDEQGKPFVGKAGQLLTEMLRAVGLERDEVFITNILKCRPPGNRDPKPEEAKSCSDYLRRQRELIKPKIILAVGRISAQTLLNTDAPVGKLRAKVHYLDGTPLIVVYHPAYLLRSLLEKRKAWQDLQLAIATVNKIKG
jgi:uracil-DNA glycosylase